MSKVIHYLPPNIPRILINRNAIKVSKNVSSTNNEDCLPQVDFRDGYDFDASLLGNCDDIVKELVNLMEFGVEEDLEFSKLDQCKREN